MTTAGILGITSVLVVLFLALWVGVPMWLIFRHPDRDPSENRTVPEYLRRRVSSGIPVQQPLPTRDVEEVRELVSANRSR